ncbi:GNAT family N-acetyltransferase [Homoserinibacter sp. GY 40078]|uniref:GNAT family N-acetyltransferase n=1 Tax=Homoserinibacter sp. GY 40078 TaxID=2603275 RepID=UPI0011C83A5B|nr:GNAT family N-acetyltransferase [Homoserinibacter sp. GY 40078]TXK17305.1 GNAT family N-acetyltransferase [Homoserinibacter sp. GY 40078]
MDEIRVVTADQVSWEQLQTALGSRGEAARCQCQWFHARDREFSSMPREEREARLREQTSCGHPGAPTSGLVAFLGEEPVGWCAVEPRSHYVRLARTRIPWSGRDEDPADDTVWAIVCFAVRVGFRRRGVSTALAVAAVGHAERNGAAAVEGYPKELAPGKQEIWGELFVGTPPMFEAAGMRVVSRPTLRRLVMRRDFA